MSRKPYPSELADKVLVRLPDGMKDKIARAASENKRSLSAEIVSRLETSFSGAGPAANQDDENGLFIVLDTDGMPISWDEIVTHIRNLSRAAHLDIHTLHTVVVTPQLLSSAQRESATGELVKRYKRLARAKGYLPK
jgi:hypothetical protein